MILLCTYQYIHHIHCHSTSITINYTSSGAKCRFGCHGWCRNTQNILWCSCKNRIISTITFSPIKISKFNALFHWRIVFCILISLWSTQHSDVRSDTNKILLLPYPYPHLPFGYGYEYELLTDVKKMISVSGLEADSDADIRG